MGMSIFWLVLFFVVFIVGTISLFRNDALCWLMLIGAFGMGASLYGILNTYDQKVVPIEKPTVTVQEYELFQIISTNKIEGSVDGQGNILHGEVEGNVSSDIEVVVFYYIDGNQTAQKEVKLSELDFVIVETEKEEKYVIKKEVYYSEDQNKSPAVIKERETKVYNIVYITKENFNKYIAGG